MEKLLDPKNTNVLKLHVFSAFWSTLLPAMITLKQILTDRDKKIAMCVSHSLGMDPKENHGDAGDSEGKNNLFREQGTARGTVSRRLDYGATTTTSNEDLSEDGFNNEHNQRAIERLDSGGEQASILKQGKLSVAARRSQLIRKNQDFVLHLCKNKAFDEGEATRLLCATPEEIAIQFNRNFGERLNTELCITQTLVFQESAKQRLERAKQLELQQNPTANSTLTILEGTSNYENLLEENMINFTEFALNTRNHFYGNTQ